MDTYRFDHFKDFFAYQNNQAQQKSASKKTVSLRGLVKKLGYNSPSLLSMIANGKRLPSAALLEALMDKWQIPNSEREGIRVQVEIERRMKRGGNVLQLLDRLKKLQGANKYRHLDFKQFEVIRHWYIYVLKELIDTNAFTEDPVLLSRQLRSKVSPALIKKGIEALLAVGLVRRNPDTHKLESTVGDTETTNGVPSEAIQEHHRSMIERALESITEQKVTERHLNSLTLRFDPQDHEALRVKLFEVIRQVNEQFQSQTSDRVFQLNIQFFEHTQPLKKTGDET